MRIPAWVHGALVCLVVVAALILSWRRSDEAEAPSTASNAERARSVPRTTPPPPAAALPGAPEAEPKEQAGARMASLPLRFEKNDGQFAEEVRYLARSNGVSLGLTDEGPILRLGGRPLRKPEKPGAPRDPQPLAAKPNAKPEPVGVEPMHELRMRVEGANPDAKLEAGEALETKTNYFLGNDRSKWRTNVANFRRVTYREILPGIDLVYHGDGRKLEYDFVVAPGADPDDITVHFDGAGKIAKNAAGELEVSLGASKLVQSKPIVYQEIAGKRQFVEGSFRVFDDTRAGFEVAEYDRTKPLVIDPVVVFATYLGGSNEEFATDVAATASNQLAVVGMTYSSNFPTASAYDSSANGQSDVSVSLLNSTGTSLIFSTYVGGNSAEEYPSVVIDSAGSIVVAGSTSSTNFPMAAAVDSVAQIGEGFVFKLQSNGSALLFSTYLGGVNHDNLRDVAVDASDAVYVIGVGQLDYPTTGSAYKTSTGGQDAVVSKLAADGSLVYSTFLGGDASSEEGFGIAVRSNGNAVVTGMTYSADFPIVGGFQSTHGGWDTFVTELNASGTALVFSSYHGGSNDECGRGIALDSTGAIYISGWTYSLDLPTTASAHRTTPNSWDLYVAKIAPDGSSRIYSTYLGGNDFEESWNGLIVDALGQAILAGHSCSSDYPHVDALWPAYNGYSCRASVTQLSPTGSSVSFSTLIGASTDQGYGYGLARTPSGQLAVVGRILGSTGLATTPGVIQASNAGSWDGFVALISLLSITPNPKTVVVGESVTFTPSGGTGPYTWSLTTNNSSGSHTDGMYTAGAAPNTTDVLQLTDTATSQTASVTITVKPTLALSPTSVAKAPAEGQSFSATGGIGGNTFAFVTNNSGGTLNPSTGAYVAGPTSNVTDTIQVTDSGGHVATATVIVGPALVIAPTSVSLPPRGTTTFTPSGGDEMFTFSVLTNNSKGAIDSGSGVYTAGDTGSVTDTVQLNDKAGRTANATVTVTAGVSLTPPSASVDYGMARTFAATGGSGTGFVYSVSMDNSGATIDGAGLYQPGKVGGVIDTVRVVDSLGNAATAAVTVAATPAILLSPPSASLPPRGQQTFAASGGTGLYTGYTYSLSTDNSKATLDSSTGLYKAGATPDTVDVVRAIDGDGNMVDAMITVGPGVSLTPTAVSVGYGGTQLFAANGGSGTGFSYAITTDNSKEGSIGATTGLYTAGKLGGATDTITVTDSLGNTATATATVGPSTLAIDPPTATVAPNEALVFAGVGGSASGYTFTLTDNQSDGTILPNGAYKAGATAETTDTITLTDGAGNTVTTTITIGVGVTIDPTTVSVPPKGEATFTAEGGSGLDFKYEITDAQSGGTIGLTTGLYAAGTTGGTTDTVTVTDSLGNTSTATITVGPGVAVNAERGTAPPRSTQTITASLGSGTGYTFELSTDASGGTVGGTDGVYIAGNTGDVTDTIRVSDSLGNIGYASVSVTAGMSLTPSAAARPPNGDLTFAAEGGSGEDYTFSLYTDASGAMLDAVTGVYKAGATGDVLDVVQVEDSLGNLATANVAVGSGIAVSPSAISLPPRGTQTFDAVGGTGEDYEFELERDDSGATVGTSSGVYTAGPLGGGIDRVLVRDALGNMGTAEINIGPIVSLSPATTAVAPRGQVGLIVAGGSGLDFVFSIALNGSGDATVDPNTGVYRAGQTGLTSDVVRVEDSLGNTATATITIGEMLAVSPLDVTVPPRGNATFTAAGGAAPYTFEVTQNGSFGRVDDESGAYTAGDTPDCSDKVTVTDANGATFEVSIAIGPGVSLEADVTQVPPGGTAQLLASGGSGEGYEFGFLSNQSDATIVDGEYIAGNIEDVTDILTVADSLGNTATLAIAVGTGVAINPPSKSLPPRGTQTFAATGGSGEGFEFTLEGNGSGGSISSAGLYVAGPTGATGDWIRATDSLGNTATAKIMIGPGVSLTPSMVSLVPSTMQSFNVSGGSGSGYTFSLPTAVSGGSVDASGTYKAGANGGSEDIVRVVDSLGNSDESIVSIGAGIALSPVAPATPPRGTLTFSAAFGSGIGFSYAVTGNASGGHIAASTGAYVAGPNGGVADTITVSDSLGNKATTTVAVGPGVSIDPPEATLAPRTSITLGATGGSGEGYSFAIRENRSGGTIDAATGTYTAGTTAGVSDLIVVTDSLGNTGTRMIAIGSALRVDPATASVPPLGTLTLVAAGGSGGYIFAFGTSASGGEIDGNGKYVAGPNGGTLDVIEVSDSAGTTIEVAIAVTSSITLAPQARELAPHSTLQFTAAGGAGNYRFELEQNGSEGAIDVRTGAYRAGETGDVTDVVKVTDALGNSATARVEVGAALEFAESTLTSPPRGRLQLEAAGGAGDNRYAFTRNESGASLDGQTGEYTAGRTGEVEDEVSVRDANGVTRRATIAVGSGVRIIDPPERVVVGDAVQFNVEGGSGEGYQWSLRTRDVGRINADTGRYVPDARGETVDVTIEVTDSLGNTARTSFELYYPRVRIAGRNSSDDCTLSARGPANTRSLALFSVLATAVVFSVRRKRKR